MLPLPPQLYGPHLHWQHLSGPWLFPRTCSGYNTSPGPGPSHSDTTLPVLLRTTSWQSDHTTIMLTRVLHTLGLFYMIYLPVHQGYSRYITRPVNQTLKGGAMIPFIYGPWEETLCLRWLLICYAGPRWSWLTVYKPTSDLCPTTLISALSMVDLVLHEPL